LLSDADRIVQRQHRDRGRELDPRGGGGDVRQHQIRARQHAERVEMMLADPGRVHAELFGMERFGADVGDELVRGAGVFFVVIVAQREIAEFHGRLPRMSWHSWERSTAAISIAKTAIIIDNALVVNA